MFNFSLTYFYVMFYILAGKLDEVLDSLTLSDLNSIQFHCDSEELSNSAIGSYVIPNYGPLVYTGLKGEKLRAFS